MKKHPGMLMLDHLQHSSNVKCIPSCRVPELAWESRCRKSSTAITSAEIATAEQVLQSPADAAHERAPAPAEVWLPVR